MKEIDKFDKLSKRIDNLDKEYSNTLSELLTDVHYIKCKVNKTDQLEYQKKENEIESDNVERLDTIKSKNFVLKFGFIAFVVLVVSMCILSAIKYLFF